MSAKSVSVRDGALRTSYEAKVLAELAEGERIAPGSDFTAAWAGDIFADVVAVKGLAGPAEESGGAPLTGPDGAALGKALEALVPGRAAFFAVMSRPEPGIAPDARAARLRRMIEAVDPRVAIALDAEAAEDLASAFGLRRLVFGKPENACGRMLLAVDGLEASLADAGRKRRVWNQLKKVELPASVY